MTGTPMSAQAATTVTTLIPRIRGILLSPGAEWEAIAREDPDARSIWLGWVLPLSLIGPVAGLVGGVVFGSPLADLVGVQYGLRYYVQAALTGFVGSFVAVALVALLARVLAPTFGATCEGNAGLKLAAYSFTASWLAGVFSLIPALAPLGLVGLYSIYLLYAGVRPLTGVPEAKALPYTATLVAIGVVASMALGWIFV